MDIVDRFLDQTNCSSARACVMYQHLLVEVKSLELYIFLHLLFFLQHMDCENCELSQVKIAVVSNLMNFSLLQLPNNTYAALLDIILFLRNKDI